MADHLSKHRRSENMRRIRSVGMKPEMLVRRLVHALGYRFRLHRKELSGKPDLVFVRRRKVIFVHGCFWHQHQECKAGRLPKSNRGYWRPKLARNIERDAQNLLALKSEGWKVCVIWECETKDEVKIRRKLRRFLGEGAT
jgi:DNA mismatch endonuclease (patch repair protein)